MIYLRLMMEFCKECHKRKFHKKPTLRHWGEQTPPICAKNQHLEKEWSRRRMRLANRIVSFN